MKCCIDHRNKGSTGNKIVEEGSKSSKSNALATRSRWRLQWLLRNLGSTGHFIFSSRLLDYLILFLSPFHTQSLQVRKEGASWDVRVLGLPPGCEGPCKLSITLEGTWI